MTAQLYHRKFKMIVNWKLQVELAPSLSGEGGDEVRFKIYYFPKTLRINPKAPSSQLNFISNCSSTITEISKTSLLIANCVDNITNIRIYRLKTKLVFRKIIGKLKCFKVEMFWEEKYGQEHFWRAVPLYTPSPPSSGLSVAIGFR